MFDSNAFSSFDKLNQGDLSSLSTSDINTLSKDPAFYAQLKSNPADLAKVQASLTSTINSTTASTQDKINAAATYVTVTTNSTSVIDVQTNAVNNIPTIKDALNESPPNYGKALKEFLGNETEAQMEATLTTLLDLARILNTLQQLSEKSDGTVDEALFFSGTTNITSFAESAFMAAVAQALVTDKGGIAAAATELSKDDPDFSSQTTDINAFKAAKASNETLAASTGASSTDYPSGYSYAYLYAVTAKMSGLL